MYDSEFLQVLPAGVSEAEQLHILLSGPEPDPDGKSQTEETHNKGKCIELIHCLWFIGLKIAIISQQPNTAQSISLPDSISAREWIGVEVKGDALHERMR